jgi:hypothetical protein
VCRMLVHDDDAVVSLKHQIGVEYLQQFRPPWPFPERLGSE